jgi:hypothetical protein
MRAYICTALIKLDGYINDLFEGMDLMAFAFQLVMCLDLGLFFSNVDGLFVSSCFVLMLFSISCKSKCGDLV